MSYIYLYLNHFTLFFPLALSLDRRLHFYTNWKNLFPAMALSAICFITWNIIFTQHGVWGFNPYNLVGNYLGSLPLEEVLFFITISAEDTMCSMLMLLLVILLYKVFKQKAGARANNPIRELV